MILKVYGDESADETRQRAFAMSAVIGSEAEWRLAKDAWLQVTGGEVFHAADCEHAKKFDFYRALTTVIADSYIAGFTVAGSRQLPTAISRPDVR